MTAGTKSSEFWLVLVFMVGMFLLIGLGKISAEDLMSIIGTALPVTGYTIGRSLIKSKNGNGVTK